jgi:hypothetical protein
VDEDHCLLHRDHVGGWLLRVDAQQLGAAGGDGQHAVHGRQLAPHGLVPHRGQEGVEPLHLQPRDLLGGLGPPGVQPGQLLRDEGVGPLLAEAHPRADLPEGQPGLAQVEGPAGPFRPADAGLTELRA